MSIRRLFAFTKNGKEQINIQTSAKAIPDLGDALDAYYDEYIAPKIANIKPTIEIHEEFTHQDALAYSIAHPDVLVFVAKT